MTSAYYLVMIVATQPILNVDVGFQFSSEAECKEALIFIAQQEKSTRGRLDCWKIESKRLTTKEESEKKMKEPKDVLKGRQS